MSETRREEWDLERLIAPLSREDFFAERWEHEPVVLRGRAGGYGDLLRTADVPFLTASVERFDRRWIRLVDARRRVRLRQYQRPGGGLDMESVHAAYAEGATLVLNDLQERWQPVERLCRRLWSDFNDRAGVPLRAIGANMYLSPPGAQGLGVHFDAHCVFVLQLDGRKSWTLYDRRRDLPSPDGRDPRRRRALRREDLPEPLHDVVLEAGDFAYLPRGLYHRASTTDHHSLHLAVGLYPYTWSDLLAHAMRSVRGCRETLPPGSLTSPEPGVEVAERFREVLSALAGGASLEDGLRPLRAELAERRKGGEDGFARHRAVAELDATSRIRRRETPAELSLRDGKVVLQLPHGRSIQAPAAVEDALRFILERDVFTVDSLPDTLTEDSKKLLVRRLVAEGLLELAS